MLDAAQGLTGLDVGVFLAALALLAWLRGRAN